MQCLLRLKKDTWRVEMSGKLETPTELGHIVKSRDSTWEEFQVWLIDDSGDSIGVGHKI